MTSVCVYCASSTQIDDKYFRAAEELGHLIAEHGLTLITGAGKLGLMNTIENAALEAGGKVTGVIPSFMVREGWHHEGLTELIETPSMHERKQTMANLSDGIIALPWGIYSTTISLLTISAFNNSSYFSIVLKYTSIN
mgnify:CR=1 FL=1